MCSRAKGYMRTNEAAGGTEEPGNQITVNPTPKCRHIIRQDKGGPCTEHNAIG